MNIEVWIILIIVGFVGFWIGQKWSDGTGRPEDNSLIEKQRSEKRENLRELIRFLKDHDKVTNDDVEELLDVSDATATNYLQELEEKGVIEQVGKEGRGVYYTLNG